MMSNKIKIQSKNIKLNELIRLLEDCDNDFIPKLSSRVNISDYSKKLLDKAEINSLVSGNKIVGIVAFYCNDFENKIAFISSLCVNKSYRGFGLSKRLIDTVIEFAKNKNFKFIRLEVGIANYKARKLYEKFNFYTIDKKEDTIIMQYEIK